MFSPLLAFDFKLNAKPKPSYLRGGCLLTKLSFGSPGTLEWKIIVADAWCQIYC